MNITLARVKGSAKHTLLSPFPGLGLRFNLKLKYLLSPEQKKVYYNELLSTLISEIENKIDTTQQGTP